MSKLSYNTQDSLLAYKIRKAGYKRNYVITLRDMFTVSNMAKDVASAHAKAHPSSLNYMPGILEGIVTDLKKGKRETKYERDIINSLMQLAQQLLLPKEERLDARG